MPDLQEIIRDLAMSTVISERPANHVGPALSILEAEKICRRMGQLFSQFRKGTENPRPDHSYDSLLKKLTMEQNAKG